MRIVKSWSILMLRLRRMPRFGKRAGAMKKVLAISLLAAVTAL